MVYIDHEEFVKRHAAFIKSSTWRGIRKKAFKYHGWKCQAPKCGARRHLEVHHITYKRFGGNERVVDLAILCRKHHQEVTDYIHAHWGEADHQHLHWHWFFEKRRKG